MNIQFYRPNKGNSGFAASFQYQPTDKQGNDCLFAQLIKQASWDAERHIGSFKESMTDPTKKVSVKLEFVEIGAILDCLDRNRPLKTVHDDQKGGTKSINFSTWMSNDEVPVLKGYSFGVTINDKENSANSNKFFIGLSLAEGRYLREFLIWVLQQHFNKETSNYKNNQDKLLRPVGVSGNSAQVVKSVEKIVQPAQELAQTSDPLVDF